MTIIPEMKRTLSVIIKIWETSHKLNRTGGNRRSIFRKVKIMIENFSQIKLKENIDFCCLICGEAIEVPFEPEFCSHVLFIYNNKRKEFVYVLDSVQPIIDMAIEEADSSCPELECAMYQLKATAVLFFEVTFSGSKWGAEPVVLTFGIDLRNCR